MDTHNDMTKKELKELRREERREMQRTEQKKTARKTAINWLIALLIIGLAVYGIVSLASRSATSRPGESISIQGREHIPVNSPRPDYNSNPPTSGSHYAQPTDWGIYSEELKDENVIHSLEHGGIWISYRPDIDTETKEKLEAIGKQYPKSVVVSPREANDAPIAIASWGKLDKLTVFDENRIIEFIKRNKNKSPEPLAR